MIMVNKQMAALVLAVSVVGGIGTGVVANALTTDEPAAVKTSGPSTDVPAVAADFVIAPGAVGVVQAGMSKTDALATGLFDADVKAPVEGCADSPLVWKANYADYFDVQTLGNGEIASIGVRKQGPVTKDGLGVGSSVADVQASVEDGTPVEAGYGQSGLFDYDGQTGRWIGYLFDPAVDDLEDTDTVTFVEVTKGSQPGLMRDGC
jgi:hypothetical protein